MAIRLNGSNQYLKTIGYKGIGGSQNRTITWWMKDTGVLADVYWNWGTAAPSAQIACNHYGPPDRIGIAVQGGNRHWTYSPDSNNYHHFAVVLDGNNTTDLVCYRDGVAMTIYSTAAKAINTGNANDVYVGSTYGATNQLAADLFDFRIYSSAKSQVEVQAAFDDGHGCEGDNDDLELRLEMRSESGLVITELDTSGNGRDATGYPDEDENNPVYVEDPFNPCVVGGGKLIDGKGIAPLIDGNLMIS